MGIYGAFKIYKSSVPKNKERSFALILNYLQLKPTFFCICEGEIMWLPFIDIPLFHHGFFKYGFLTDGTF